MKRYIANILIFFTIVAVADFCVGSLGDYLQSHAKGGATRCINDLVMEDVHDVVILGSSRAHHHYDTPFLSDTLGLDVYNAGYDGNGVVLADGLLELMLERYHPKLVLFDVEPAFDILEYPNDNHHIRYISTLKPYYRHAAVGNIIQDVSEEEWYKVHSGLIRYNSNLVAMAKDNFYNPFGKFGNNHGYEPLAGVYDKTPDAEDDSGGSIDMFKLKYVELLIKTSKEHHVPIVLIASPKLGAENSLVFETVKQICDRLDIDFLDYYTEPEFQIPNLYKEPMHLNKDGAREFSAKIAGEIANRL